MIHIKLMFGNGDLGIEHGTLSRGEYPIYVAIYPSYERQPLGSTIKGKAAKDCDQAVWLMFKNIDAIENFELQLSKAKGLL